MLRVLRRCNACGRSCLTYVFAVYFFLFVEHILLLPALGTSSSSGEPTPQENAHNAFRRPVADYSYAFAANTSREATSRHLRNEGWDNGNALKADLKNETDFRSNNASPPDGVQDSRSFEKALLERRHDVDSTSFVKRKQNSYAAAPAAQQACASVGVRAPGIIGTPAARAAVINSVRATGVTR